MLVCFGKCQTVTPKKGTAPTPVTSPVEYFPVF